MKLHWICTLLMAAASLQGCAGLDESFAQYDEEQRCTQSGVGLNLWDGTRYQKDKVNGAKSAADKSAEIAWAKGMQRTFSNEASLGESRTVVSPVTGATYQLVKHCTRYRSSPSRSSVSAPASRTYRNSSVSAPGIK